MRISIAQLCDALESSGFELTWLDEVCRDLKFARGHANSDLFEHLWISCLGKTGDALTAKFGVSVVFGGALALKELVHIEHSLEMDEDKVHGYTKVSSSDQSAAWIRKLVSISLTEIPKHRGIHGPSLLARTGDLRLLAAECHAGHNEHDFDTFREQLRKLATPSDLREAVRIAEWVFVSFDPRATDIFEAAVLLLLRNKETSALVRGSNPFENRDVYGLIQLVADQVMRTCDLWPNFWTVKSKKTEKFILGRL